jgi:hypothetical protein
VLCGLCGILNEELNVDTATRTPTSEPAFHADDVELVPDYRTLSALAIVGLLFGLASVLCLASRLFLVVPLIGAALSLVAIRRIAASEGLLAGRGAAATGLALCVAFGLAAISRDAVTRHLRTRQAREFGRQWISALLSGDTNKAFRQTVDAMRPAPAPPEPGMPEPPRANPYEEFRKHPLVHALAIVGTDAQIESLRTLRYELQARKQFVIEQQFSIAPSEAATDTDPNLRPVNAKLTLQRSSLRGERASRWLVAAYELSPDTGDDTNQTEIQ